MVGRDVPSYAYAATQDADAGSTLHDLQFPAGKELEPGGEEPAVRGHGDGGLPVGVRDAIAVMPSGPPPPTQPSDGFEPGRPPCVRPAGPSAARSRHWRRAASAAVAGDAPANGGPEWGS